MGFYIQSVHWNFNNVQNCFVYWSLKDVRCHWHETQIQLMEISLSLWEQFQSGVGREDESESGRPFGFLCPWLHDCRRLHIQYTRERS